MSVRILSTFFDFIISGVGLIIEDDSTEPEEELMDELLPVIWLCMDSRRPLK